MKLYISVVVLLFVVKSNAVTLKNGKLSLSLNIKDDTIDGVLKSGDETILSGQTFGGHNLTSTDSCEGQSNCVFFGSALLNVTSITDGFKISWFSNSADSVFKDCFDLNKENLHWYGGQEKWTPAWPIDDVKIANRPYRSSKDDYGAIAERYWLNSKGTFLFVNDDVPLFIDQNNEVDGGLCLISKSEKPFNKKSISLEYVVVVKENPRDAHLHAVNNYLGKPKGHPNKWIIKHPIWTTWAKYKKEINDQKIIEFAQSIHDHGFTGQIEIDDNWETCYGSLKFNDDFANITNTVDYLKSLGFTVTLWTHPFVDVDCEETVKEGLEKGYFATSTDGTQVIPWWDNDKAYHIDFTKQEAADWFTNRLNKLIKDHHLDSFKFDAGEADWAPETLDQPDSHVLGPNALTQAYIRTAAKFGDLIEVRSGFRTQDLPIFVRMLDRDSRWNLDDGLHSVIVTTLQFNIVGYTMVLPDIVGGDAYGERPTAELLARWIQANTFLPAMQFSELPWEITSPDFDGVAIIKKFVNLHRAFADDIIAAMEKSISDGHPVNAPIWWIDPTNEDALKTNDEYLLGENILVAPIVIEGARSRDIVLPTGTWKDGNSNKTFQGPSTIKDYPAPIDVLPYFIKQ